MSEISAYEKMLKDGTAFKKIDMQRIQNQQYAQAGIGTEVTPTAPKPEPLGSPAQENRLEEDHTDFSAVDNAMQKKINALREKMNPGKQTVNESEEIAKLKTRIKKLEEAVMLIMESHTKLLT